MRVLDPTLCSHNAAGYSVFRYCERSMTARSPSCAAYLPDCTYFSLSHAQHESCCIFVLDIKYLPRCLVQVIVYYFLTLSLCHLTQENLGCSPPPTIYFDLRLSDHASQEERGKDESEGSQETESSSEENSETQDWEIAISSHCASHWTDCFPRFWQWFG